ncbi:MAG: hypothetical protein ACM31E_06560, partial [Fibrobacterota bacterium]|nr:hypothetical protein [Chitinispirillaceae bacterium]
MSVNVKNLTAAISVIILTVLLSILSTKFQGYKEEGGEKKPLIVNDTMTIGQFGIVNSIPNQTLKETLKLTNKSDLDKKISATGFSNDQITELFQKQSTLKAEYESRNWIKIPVKFGLTIALLIATFILLRKGNVTTRVRV